MLTNVFVLNLVQSIIWCAMPIVIVWLVMRHRANETNKRTQIAMAAIEKNADIDVQQLVKQLSPKRKSLKERLLQKLLWGSVCSLLGLGLIIYAMVAGYMGGQSTGGIHVLVLWAIALLVVGIAFLVNYVVGKKVLHKEIEAEEKEIGCND